MNYPVILKISFQIISSAFEKALLLSKHCIEITRIETWKKILDSNESFGALLTDLSKAFVCVKHRLLIAKIHAYGLDSSSLRLIHSYLNNRQ